MSTSWGSEDRKLMVYLPEVGVRLAWVSRIVEPERMVTVIGWLLGIEDSPSREVNWIDLGNF